eukprot:TRINITY_DN4322_c0_g2_i1.p1 TRINITY_DN4322_c0_g2~~TRINITY_DN4322_c0_g2_i1.p1  ORF type:complete len:265 (-),score=63.93 TRINITY_DN4322_c0_g2_i1:83-877(-)
MVALKRVVTGPATKTVQVVLSMDYTGCAAPSLGSANNSTAPSAAAAINSGSNGALIGGIVGGVAALILIIIIVVLVLRRRGSGSGGSTKSHEMKPVKPATAKPAATSVSSQPASTASSATQSAQGPTYTIPASSPASQTRPYSQPQPVGFTPQTAAPAMNPRPVTAGPASPRSGGSIFTPAADVDLDKPNFPQPTSYVYYDSGQQDQEYQQQPYEDQQQQQYYADPAATDNTDFTFQTFRSNKNNYGNVQPNATADSSMYIPYN